MRFENDQVWSALKPGSQIVTMLWGGEGPLMVAYSKVGALGARHLAALGVFFLVAACATIEGGPHRLYTVDQEVGEAQVELPTLLGYYYKAGAGSDAQKYYRNEYVARRMYIIDVEYSDYEAALTSERQKFTFGAAVTGGALNTIGALSPAGATARALNGAAGAVNATSGYYDSDLVIAKTIQIVEAQMRGQRDLVAKTILQRRDESTTTYPLAAALSDLEDYYRAGTMNSGLIQAAGDAANNAAGAAAAKDIVVTYGSNASTATLAACLNKPGAVDKLVALMSPHSHARLAALAYDTSPMGESARSSLLAKAKAAGICP
jgi:hypothetical protein